MKIGLIAGSGQFPIIFSKKAKLSGFDVYALAHLHETNPHLEEHVAAIEWVHIGRIKRLIKFFKKHGVKEAVMVGGIQKAKWLKTFRPDTKAISLIAGMKHTHDDNLLSGFAKMLEKDGISIKDSTFLLPDLLSREGCWTSRKPTRSENSDVAVGWKLAKEIGRLDIGQCVVVAGGSVLAVEAIDGTDETIRRGGKLGEGMAVVVKVCKPNQDTRFDIPAIGSETIATMEEAGVRVLAIEAGKAVVFDRDKMIAMADRAGISIIALAEDPEI